jgi:hypothetical protein
MTASKPMVLALDFWTICPNFFMRLITGPEITWFVAFWLPFSFYHLISGPLI